MKTKELKRLLLIRIGIFKLEDKEPTTVDDIYDSFSSLVKWKRNTYSLITRIASDGLINIVDGKINITEEGIDKVTEYITFFEEMCGTDKWVEIVEFLLKKDEKKKSKKKPKKKDTKKKSETKKKDEKSKKEILDKDEPIEL